MIKEYSLNLLEKALNKAVHLDPTMRDKLLCLEGKVIQLIVAPLQTCFFITFNGGVLRLLVNTSLHPDTVIESSPLGLIRLSLLPVSKARSLFHDDIKLTGDIELGQQVKKLLDDIDIDWEGHLAHFTGDVIAYQVGSLFRRGVSLKKELTQSFCANVTEYIQEERGVFPPKEEVTDFCNDVDSVVADVERLAAQINYLYDADAKESDQ